MDLTSDCHKWIDYAGFCVIIHGMSEKSVTPQAREEPLNRRRVQKMAESAHAFVRGSTTQFYEWLNGKARKSLPSGPPIWICGDCHTGNLGPIADLQGKIDIQIRDLDQTVIGNPAHDILRLGLSLAMAARGSDLPGITTALMMEALIKGYNDSLAGRPSSIEPEEIAPIEKVMDSALKRKWRNLAEERIEDVKPCIPLGTKFWPLQKNESEGLKKMLEEAAQESFIQLLTRQKKKVKVELVDAAYWVKGCSSLAECGTQLWSKRGKDIGSLTLRKRSKHVPLARMMS